VNNIRIGHLTTSYHTAFILMGTDQLEKRIDVKPEWILFPTGPEMVKSFARGELDIGYIGLPPAMIGMSRGMALRCIAGGHMEGTVLTARSDIRTYEETGSIKETLEQLNDLTVGAPSKGSIHDIIIRNLLDKADLADSVSVRNFDWADLALYAMESGEVQAVAGTPALAVLASRLLGARMILPPKVMWPCNPSYGIVATLEMIENSVEFLREFLVLHEDACNLIRREPRTAARIASEAVGIMDEEFILEVYKISPKYCASLPAEYVCSTMAFVPVLRKIGYIDTKLMEDNVFSKAIIETIHEEPSHYDSRLS
jgi:NitT/TauT family transport system substrate-binding protein